MARTGAATKRWRLRRWPARATGTSSQLHNYRDGRRGTHQDDVHGATMQPFAATLVDDAAIVDVVAYINSLH
jgi:cytochrome c553